MTLIEEGEIYIRKINESKSTITNLENTFNVITKRIEDMKKPFILLQERNDELMCENERLNALISANGTEALTPRPDYRTLQEEKKIELDIFDITGKSQVISTSVVIEELMKKIADLTQKNQEPSLKDGAKPINLTIANINAKRGGNRSRAGSFNINSPLKPPKSNSLQESLNASPLPGGKSLFGRMAPRNPSQFGSGVSQFNPSPSQFAPNQSTTGRPGASLFGNTLNPTSIYDFKERTPTSDAGIKDDFSSLCPESIDNSPSDCKTDSNSTPKSSGKYILRIEIPKKRRNSGKEEALERADDLISYIARTKEDIENFVSNL